MGLEALMLISTAAMVGLCLFGVVTLSQVLRCQLAVKRWIVRLNMVSDVFRGHLQFESYEPFESDKVSERVKARFGNRPVGSSSNVVTAINIGVGAAAAGILSIWLGMPLLGAVSMLAVTGLLIGAVEVPLEKILIRWNWISQVEA